MGRFNLAEHLPPAQPAAGRDIEAITAEILSAKRRAGESILTIGRGLAEAKALLPHGEWLPWLENRVEFSEKSAQNFMRIARHYSNPQALADLGATKALMLLALPDESRDEFISAPHLVGGEEKTVIDMTTRELETAIKERDEALKAAAQAKAEQSAAEQAREKMEQDMVMIKQLLGTTEAERDAAAEESETAQEAFQASEQSVARLERELAELKARPVEVAVEVDADAVEKARKEGEEAERARQERALKTARAAAQEQVMSANQAAAQAKTELAQARRELENYRFELDRAQRRAGANASGDLALFGVLLEQVQAELNKMGGVLMKMRGSDAAAAGRLEQALLALAEKVKEVAKR